MKERYKINYDGLEEYLKQISILDIETDWKHPIVPLLTKAIAIDDVEFYNVDPSTIESKRLINYGEPFLVDAMGNDLSIVILTRRKYKLPDSSRAIRAKFIKTIISDCRALYGTPLNGYWKIPLQFVQKLKH